MVCVVRRESGVECEVQVVTAPGYGIPDPIEVFMGRRK